MNEDQIERLAAAKYDALDRLYMRGAITHEAYEAKCREISAWAERSVAAYYQRSKMI